MAGLPANCYTLLYFPYFYILTVDYQFSVFYVLHYFSKWMMTTMVAMAEDDDDMVCNAGDSENM